MNQTTPTRDEAVLLPCPFCGSEARHEERHNPLSRWKHSIDCRSSSCGMSGPVASSKAEAVRLWNDRAALASAPAPASGAVGAAFRTGLDAAAEYLLACDDYGDRHKADEIRKLPAPASLSPAATPPHIANCCHCGRIVDTREKSEGGDDWGHQLSDQRWVCSPDCLDAVTDPAATPVSEAEPVAWVIPGDDTAKDNGFIDAMAWQEGEFTRPLYDRPAVTPVSEAACEPGMWSPKIEAIRLLKAEDQRQLQILELLETIREQVRLGVKPEHRPDGLMKNLQTAVYGLRGRMPLLNDAAIMAPLQAKPASSPAVGDVVREALEAYHDAYSDRRFAPEGSHEAYDAAARLEDAHDLASRALSQSTSAGSKP